jgi:tetratricopeptide (TPR) repeat protein
MPPAPYNRGTSKLFKPGITGVFRLSAADPNHFVDQANSAETHFRQGNQFREQSDSAEAILCYEQALRMCEKLPEVHANLGIALAEQGKLDEAIGHWRRALELRPGFAHALSNLGVALTKQGKLEEARDSLEQALRYQPDFAEAAYNLGILFMQQRKRLEAIARFEETLRLQPDHAQAYNSLGLVLQECGKPGEAAMMLGKAVRIRPAFFEAYNNLGLAYAAQGKLDLAEASFQEALRLNPRCAAAHANLGNLYADRERHEESLACYQLADWLKPDSPARWLRAMALLAMGDYVRGWPEFEGRWQLKELSRRTFKQPPWDGSPLDGQTILLTMEQGFGDMLQFIRYASLVKERGGTVIVECYPGLLPLCSLCLGIDRLVDKVDDSLQFDVHAPLMSLPALCGTTLSTVPAQVPYLFPDPEEVDRWRRELDPVPDFKVGIAWQGNPDYANDGYRSIPLLELEPLARVPGVRLYSLQKGKGTEQLRSLGGRFEVAELTPELDATGGAFMETAAVMKNLDLVIAPDTAVAHLAGALGVSVWVALMHRPDWRWLRDRDDSPWYPTMRLFRQSQPVIWGPVFERMAVDLHKRVRDRTTRESSVSMSP